MLDDLLKKIKAALPEPLKSKFLKKNDDDDEEDYEDEDEDEEGEFDEDTEVGIKKGKKSKVDEEDDDDDEEDDDEDEDEEEPLDNEEAKKKKKQKLIRAVVAFVFIFIVIDELFLKNDEPVVESPTAVTPPPQPTGQSPDLEQTKGGLNESVPTEQTAIESAPTPTNTLPESEVDKPIELSTAQIVQEETSDFDMQANDPPGANLQDETATINTDPNSISEVSPGETTIEEESAEADFTWAEPSFEEPLLEESPLEEEQTSSRMGEAVSPQAIEQVETQPKQEKPKDIAGAIAGIVSEKVEYTEPPVYSIQGRGLVYNCKGRHWACIDRAEYFQCRDNMLWSEQNKQKPECVIRNVYASYDDCRTIQIHYINLAESTDFCD